MSLNIAKEFTILFEDGRELTRSVRGAFGIKVIVIPVFRHEIRPHDDFLWFRHPMDAIFASVEGHLLTINFHDKRHSQLTCIGDMRRKF